MKHLYFFFFVFFFYKGIAQVTEPQSGSVNALMQYESHPVDLNRGIPAVNLPFFTLPTYNENISLPVGLSYHPLSVAVNSGTSECGKGWTLGFYGAISRSLLHPSMMTTNEANNLSLSVFSFNFMGHNGKLRLEKNANGWHVRVLENGGSILAVKALVSNDIVMSFTVYDDSGNQYVFNESERFTYINQVFNPGGSNFQVPFKNNYLLTGIFSNGVEIVRFDYNARAKTEIWGGQTITKELSKVTAHGHGTIEIPYRQFTPEQHRVIPSLIIKNISGETVQNINFSYNKENLTSVSYGLGSDMLSYGLFYRKLTPLNSVMEPGVDKWGYKNAIRSSNIGYVSASAMQYTSPQYVADGVLSKIVLPTGGSIIYKYESNTYSYIGNEPMTFTGLNYNNLHNYNVATFSSHVFSPPASPNYYFTLTSGKTLYFTFETKGYMGPNVINDPNAPEAFFWPGFRIYNSAGNVVYTFQKGGDNYRNNENGGLGAALTLPSGQYRIQLMMSGYSLGEDRVHISTATPKSTPKKEFYGNGIRIAKIGYFTQSDVPEYYYDYGGSQFIAPAKETSYNYNFFEDPFRSSGTSLLPFGSENKPRNVAVYYKEVTVIESGGNGKTTYKFSTPINDSVAVTLPSYRYGKLLEKAQYDESGALVRKLSYDYQYNSDGQEPQLFMHVPGWAKPYEQKEQLYFPGGKVLTKTLNLQYNMQNRQVKQFTETDSEGGTVITKFEYHTFTGHEVLNYIAERKKVERFKDGELVRTDVFNFESEDIGTVLRPVTAWRPASVATATAGFPLKTKMIVDDYNLYGRHQTTEIPNGMATAYIYGYHGSKVVAKIENMKFSDIPSALVDAIQTQSDSGNEQALKAALANLRNAPELAAARVTTFTHKPLVGISTVTDHKGLTITYEYDGLNRLTAVRDHLNNLLSENEFAHWAQF